MKKVLIILILFISCKDGKKEKQRPEPPRCTMGLDSTYYLNLKDSAEIADMTSKKPPRKQDPTPPTPVPVTPELSNAVILHDFDGGIVSGTNWNYLGDIHYEPANLDSSGMIRVMKDFDSAYSNWYLSSTTSEAVYNAAPASRRHRIIYTISYQWWSSGAGGVSFKNTFGTPDPSFVFTSLLGFNTWSINRISSHEFGHTLGLDHQTTATSQYNPCADVACTVSPVMGNTMARPYSVWMNSTVQNDTLIISKKLKRR